MAMLSSNAPKEPSGMKSEESNVENSGDDVLSLFFFISLDRFLLVCQILVEFFLEIQWRSEQKLLFAPGISFRFQINKNLQ